MASNLSSYGSQASSPTPTSQTTMYVQIVLSNAGSASALWTAPSEAGAAGLGTTLRSEAIAIKMISSLLLSSYLVLACYHKTV